MKFQLFTPLASVSRNSAGAAFVEFALSLPILLFFVVIATDYALERYAEMQLQTATIAAAEYAVNLGCNSSEIASTAQKALSPLSNWLIKHPQRPNDPLIHVRVDSQAKCACGADTGSFQTVSYDAPKCDAAMCSSGLSAAAYVTISLSAIYNPVSPSLFLPPFSPFWSGKDVSIHNSVTVRTSGGTTNCSG